MTFTSFRGHKLSGGGAAALPPRQSSTSPQRLQEARLGYQISAAKSPPNKKQYMASLSFLGRKSQWAQALNLLEQMCVARTTPDEMTFNKLISICARCAQWKEALQLLVDMQHRDLTPDAMACNIVISALAKSGEWGLALLVLGQMQLLSVAADAITYNAVICACVRGEKWQRALQLLEGAQRQGPGFADVITYSTAINGCAKALQWEMTLLLLDEMQASDLHPNEISYSTAIRACARGDVPMRALDLFECMKENDVPQNLITYDAVIGACQKDRELWSSALHYLQDMRHSGIKPDTGIYNMALNACQNAFEWGRGLRNQWLMAEQLLEDMHFHALVPDLMTYFFAVSACEKAGRWERALELFGDMRHGNIQPDEIIYNVAISACQDAGVWQCALILLGKMQAVGLLPGAIHYTAAITACEKARQWQQALHLAGQMQLQGLEANVITYTALIRVNAHAGRWKTALKIIAEMQEGNEEPNALTYTAAISACHADVQWELALHWKNDMQQHGIEPYFTTYTHLVSMCAEAQQWEWVFQLLDEIYYKHTGSENFNVGEIYSLALVKCWKHREWGCALKLATDMLELGISTDVTCLHALLAACERDLSWAELTSAFQQCGCDRWSDLVSRSAAKTLAVLARDSDSGNCRDALGSVVLAVELLSWHGLANRHIELDFEDRLYKPMLDSLRHGVPPGPGHAQSLVLGSSFTDQALRDLQLLQGTPPWLTGARIQMRRILHPVNSGAAQESQAALREDSEEDETLVGASSAWLACNVRLAGQPALAAQSRGRAVEIQNPSCGEWFASSSVDAALGQSWTAIHRPALLQALSLALQLGEWEAAADRGLRGSALAYTAATPCVSCLAAYVQLRQSLPALRIRVAFDGQRQTSHWTDGTI